MRGIFLTVITLSQLFGALLVFAYFDAAMQGSPLGTLSAPQMLILLVTILIYLAGLIGSILIWTSKPIGLGLSLIHQLMLVPLFVIPDLFFWVTGDALGLGLAVGINTIDTITINFSLLFSLGTHTLLQALSPVVGTSYYGANIFALICALYLNRLRKRRIFAAAAQEE